MLTVKDVMVAEVITISPLSTLREALSVVNERRTKSLVVERQHTHDAYGMPSHVAQEDDVDFLNADDAPTVPAIAVNETLLVRQAAALMNRYHLSRLLVVESNHLVGLLAMNNILARRVDELT